MNRTKHWGMGTQGESCHLLATSLAPIPNANPYASTVALPNMTESFADIYMLAMPAVSGWTERLAGHIWKDTRH